MDNIVLITLVTVASSLVVLMFLLSREQRKLREDYSIITDYLERNNKDIAGLCSAAISVDAQLLNNNDQLQSVIEKVNDFEQQQQESTQPYFNAIEMIRQGVSAEELTQQCGITQEEAILLIRLHGNNS